MRNITPIVLLFIILLAGCKSKSNVVTTKSKPYKTTRPVTNNKTPKRVTVIPKTPPETTNESPTASTPEDSELVYGTSTADNIIKKALSYRGTKYRYGGVTKKGIDCSGLMHVSYKSQNIILPRSSYEQSKKGVKIDLSDAQKGDLLFFKTTSKNRISHVGLIIEIDDEDIRFIHASTSRGVIISSLKEGYWNRAFVEARTIL